MAEIGEPEREEPWIVPIPTKEPAPIEVAPKPKREPVPV